MRELTPEEWAKVKSIRIERADVVDVEEMAGGLYVTYKPTTLRWLRTIDMLWPWALAVLVAGVVAAFVLLTQGCGASAPLPVIKSVYDIASENCLAMEIPPALCKDNEVLQPVVDGLLSLERRSMMLKQPAPIHVVTDVVDGGAQ